jgi:hypothetical protein
MMTLLSSRSLLLMPLVYLAGMAVVLEEAFWRAGNWIGGWVARLPLARLFEKMIVALPPWAAVCAFVLPGIVLTPVKLLALLAMANGHAIAGLATYVVVKLASAALVARIYALALPRLLEVTWFALWHGRVIAFKNVHLDRARATRVWRRIARAVDDGRRALGQAGRQLRRALRRVPSSSSGKPTPHMVRVARRFAALRRARRIDPP